jgi:hypothetical protein
MLVGIRKKNRNFTWNVCLCPPAIVIGHNFDYVPVMYVLRPKRTICINEVECVLCEVRVQAEEIVKLRASSMIDFKRRETTNLKQISIYISPYVIGIIDFKCYYHAVKTCSVDYTYSYNYNTRTWWFLDNIHKNKRRRQEFSVPQTLHKSYHSVPITYCIFQVNIHS